MPYGRKPDIYRRPNSTFLWIRFYDAAGALVRRSSSTADENEARKILRQHLDEVEAQKAIAQGKRNTEIKITISKSNHAGARVEREELSVVRVVDVLDEKAVEVVAELAKEQVLRLLESELGTQNDLTTPSDK